VAKLSLYACDLHYSKSSACAGDSSALDDRPAMWQAPPPMSGFLHAQMRTVISNSAAIAWSLSNVARRVTWERAVMELFSA